MKFIIDRELADLNTYIKAINSHYHSGNELKQSETEYVRYMIMKQKVKPISKYPVTIHFAWYSKDQRKDIDNVAFSKKFAMDGMVRSGILENDSRKFVNGFTDKFFIDKDNPRVEITIIE